VTVQDTYYTVTGAPVIVGDTLQLTLSAIYSDTVLPVAIQGTWTSSNPAVATIDGSTCRPVRDAPVGTNTVIGSGSVIVKTQ
jgi:hypothetical protein